MKQSESAEQTAAMGSSMRVERMQVIETIRAGMSPCCDALLRRGNVVDKGRYKGLTQCFTNRDGTIVVAHGTDQDLLKALLQIVERIGA